MPYKFIALAFSVMFAMLGATSGNAQQSTFSATAVNSFEAQKTNTLLTMVQNRRRLRERRGFQQRRYDRRRYGRRRGRGDGVGAGIAIGIIGALIASGISESEASSRIARCEATFRSFDAETGTYIASNGQTRRCPYL